jgi:hypothetical protein
MSAAARLAWFACGLALALAFAALAFLVLNRSTPGISTLGSRVEDGIFGVALLAFPIVGALVASRHPRNPIGWIFVACGVMFALAAFANQYGVYALFTKPGSLPAPEVMGWLQSWLFLAPLGLTAILLFLLFPNGRLASRRWRPVLWLAPAAIVTGLLVEMLTPSRLESFYDVRNPFQVEGSVRDALEVAGNVAFLLILGCILAAAISLVNRFRRARGVERQQIKWVTAAGAVVAGAFASGPAVLWYVLDPAYEAVIVVAIAGVPVAAGVSILRYRLYEIDRIINRTVVYGALSALLAGLYFGIVLALQQVFSGFAGGSDLAIAVSTLAVAALFRPVRSRIQAFVDRRFYRAKYDAQETLEAFSARLRDEIDLDALAGELRGVVQETMQPAHVTLWLRPTGVER